LERPASGSQSLGLPGRRSEPAMTGDRGGMLGFTPPRANRYHPQRKAPMRIMGRPGSPRPAPMGEEEQVAGTTIPQDEDDARRLADLDTLSRQVLARQALRHLRANRLRRLGIGLCLAAIGAATLSAAGWAWALTDWAAWRPLVPAGVLLALAGVTLGLVRRRMRRRRPRRQGRRRRGREPGSSTAPCPAPGAARTDGPGDA